MGGLRAGLTYGCLSDRTQDGVFYDRVTLYSDSVSPSTLRLSELAQQVLADMAAGEGVAWWDLDREEHPDR